MVSATSGARRPGLGQRSAGVAAIRVSGATAAAADVDEL